MELTTVVLRGRVGSDPILNDENQARPFARFRMVVPKYRRKTDGEWEELAGTWYTVKMWGSLAQNASQSLLKGHPVVVVGRPQAQAWTNREGETVSELAVTANTIGHDLAWGTSAYTKPEILFSANGIVDSSAANAGDDAAAHDEGVPEEADVPF